MVTTSLADRVPTAPVLPLHPLLSGNRLVLGFTGRRSGTRYATRSTTCSRAAIC